MSQQIEKLDLFKFFQEFFNRSSTSNYHLISDKVKVGHSFMLRRYLSIKYPEVCQALNRIDSAATIDAVRLLIVPANSVKSPGWMYIYSKVGKQAKLTDAKEILTKYSTETIEHYKQRHGYNQIELEMILAIDYHEVVEELKLLEEQLNKKAKAKKR